MHSDMALHDPGEFKVLGKEKVADLQMQTDTFIWFDPWLR